MPRSTRQSAKQAQADHLSSGNIHPTVDWQCRHCKQWYMNRYGGAKKHWEKCSIRLQRAATARARVLRTSVGAENDDTTQDVTVDTLAEKLHQTLQLDSVALEPESSEDDITEPGSPHSRLDTRLAMDTTFDPYSVPLKLGETLVVPHAHSQRPPYIVKTSDLLNTSLEHNNCRQDPNPTFAPWAPFNSLSDFEQAEVFVNYNCTNSHINSQLRVVHSASSDSEISLQSAKDVHKILAQGAVAENLSEFNKVKLEMPYSHGGVEEIRSYTLRYKDALDPILHVLEDEALTDMLNLYSEKHYIRRPGPKGDNMRVWSDSHTGDDWHDMQEKIGEDNVVIHLIYYADATQLNSFGTKKAWAIYLWVGNVPKHQRNSHGKGRAILVGYLPEVPRRPTDDSSALASHRAEVYHEASRRIIRSCKTAAQVGVRFVTQDDTRNGIPILAVMSMDYEERVRAAAILGARSAFPCPICLVPNEDQWRLGDWPKRSQASAQRLIALARLQSTAAAKKRVLSEQSIRDLNNAFFEVFGIYWTVYKMFAGDPLHEIEGGEAGKHFWIFLMQLHILDKDMKARVDELFKKMPPFPGIHHFPNGVTPLEYITGSQHGVILRYLAPLICDMRPELDALVVPALRELACILLLARLKVHTEDTLALLEAHIKRYSEATEKIRDSDLGMDFAWPKHHTILNHLVDHIKEKGTIDNASTDLGEALHPQSKVDWDGTNHQPDTAQDQMLRKARERDVIMHIRARVDNTFDPSYEQDDDGDEDLCIEPPRVQLGSRQRVAQVHSLAHQVREEFGYPDFEMDLLKFLQHAVDPNISQITKCRVTPHRSLRIRYQCEVTAESMTDIIHVTPIWRNKDARYDTVLLQGSTAATALWAQVLVIFSIRLPGRTLNMALVHEYKTLGRHRYHKYIEVKKSSEYRFIFTDSIIRASHILPSSWSSSRQTVQDLTDGDMYLRLLRQK